MKKTKNLFLMAIFTFVAFVCMGVANAQIDFNNYRLICEPTALEPGESAQCYLIASMATGSSGSDDGVISVAYTDKNLELNGTTQLGISGVTSEYLTNGQSPSGAGSNIYTKASGDIAKDYKCDITAYTLGSSDSVSSDNVKTSGCVITYTTSSSSSTDAKLTTTAWASATLGKFVSSADSVLTNYYVLAIYNVSLSTNATKECGEICAKAWTIPAGTYYSNTTCTEADSSKGCGGSVGTGKGCSEIEYTGTPSDEDEPGTGSFVSYALLAACACIAIAAISIAKKNNKVYKV